MTNIHEILRPSENVTSGEFGQLADAHRAQKRRRRWWHGLWIGRAATPMPFNHRKR